MPGRDGTGPAFYGSMPMKRFGFRNIAAACLPPRMFSACRFGYNYRQYGCLYASTKEALAAEKAILEKRIAEIDASLNQ